MTTTQIASATADTNTTHKGDTRMTISKEQEHALEVLRLIAETDDGEGSLRHELVQMSRDYTTVRNHLIAAIKALRTIDREFGYDEGGHDEVTDDLRGILTTLRCEEIALLELFSNMNEASESFVHDGSNEFAGKNDVTISGMSDTTLLATLDGKAY
jgi:hypothetical protein